MGNKVNYNMNYPGMSHLTNTKLKKQKLAIEELIKNRKAEDLERNDSTKKDDEESFDLGVGKLESKKSIDIHQGKMLKTPNKFPMSNKENELHHDIYTEINKKLRSASKPFKPFKLSREEKLSIEIKEKPKEKPKKSNTTNMLSDCANYKTLKHVAMPSVSEKPISVLTTTVSTRSNTLTKTFSTNESKAERLPSVTKAKPTIKTSSNNIEHYKFIKVIGQGSFGKVILSKHIKTEELFAIKCIKKLYLVSNPKDLENLKNEHKTLKKLSHPFIAKLHCTFQSPEKVYFAFSYYNGGELFYILQKTKKIDENKVRYFAAEIYLALKYLHDNGIVYRDLKPENIILDKFGNVKLIDFGMCKEGVSTYKLTNTFCGTNEYLPPEVLRGDSYGFNFDWWSFGIILFEMINGFPPFQDKDKANLYRKIMHQDPEFSSTVNVSSECKDLVMKLLKKNMNSRIDPGDIPNHPWFKSINFKDLQGLKLKSPFIPKVNGNADYSNIDPIFLNQPVNSPNRKKESSTAVIDQTLFEGL